MRTTLTIDDDVLAAARQMAECTGESIGTIISQMARQSILDLAGERTQDPVLGIDLLPRRPGAPAPALQLVNALRDELD